MKPSENTAMPFHSHLLASTFYLPFFKQNTLLCLCGFKQSPFILEASTGLHSRAIHMLSLLTYCPFPLLMTVYLSFPLEHGLCGLSGPAGVSILPEPAAIAMDSSWIDMHPIQAEECGKCCHYSLPKGLHFQQGFLIQWNITWRDSRE